MSFKHYNHLNVPDSWERYFTKYPQGMTILESLFEWVSQVDSMVDNQNNLNTNVEQFRNEIDDFVGRFDERLRTEVTDTLKDWQVSGFLDVVVNAALQWQLDGYITANERDKVTLNTQLKQKLTSGQGEITSADLSQEVKEQLTGGSVAVVGINSILEDNIVNRQVSARKTDFFKYGRANVFNPLAAEAGALSIETGVEGIDVEDPSGRMRTGYFPLNDGDSADGVEVTINFAKVPINPYIFIYNAKGVPGIRVTDYILNGKQITFTVTGDYRYIRTVQATPSEGVFLDNTSTIMANGYADAEILKHNNLADVFAKKTDVPSQLNNAKQSVSFIGDSITSFEGWIPSGHQFWYSSETSDGTGVVSVSQTWWHQLIKEANLKLLVNDSWSGSSVANATENGTVDETHRSAVNRYAQHFGQGNITQSKADIIFVFMGTNDSGRQATLGTVKHSDWTAEDLKTFGGSYSKLMAELKYWNPTARIINIMNGKMTSGYQNIQTTVCGYYEIENVVIPDYSAVGVHPDVSGMTTIKNLVLNAL